MSSVNELEEKYVLSVYDDIANHFSLTRHTPWPNVAEYLESLPPASIVYDIGCGNGKYCQVNPSLVMIGADSSVQLLSFCQEKGMTGVAAEAKRLPFRSNSGDHIICIAMLHHLASQENRMTALKELIRILKPSGTAMITVWAFEQQNKQGSESKYILKKSKKKSWSKNKPVSLELDTEIQNNQSLREEGDEGGEEEVRRGGRTDADRTTRKEIERKETRTKSKDHEDEKEVGDKPKVLEDNCKQEESTLLNTLPKETHKECNSSSFSRDDVVSSLPVHKNRTAFEAQDVLVPWKCKDSGKTFLRYYHVFVQNELSSLCQEIPGVTVIQEYLDEGNWSLVLKKT